MCGPISGSAYSNKGVVSNCCCGCTLRTGSLIIGWLQVIGSILFLINLAVERGGGVAYVQVIIIIIGLVTGLLILIGTYKLNAKIFWAAVYLTIILVIWSLIYSIIFFVNHNWSVGGAGIIGFIINIYFIIVLRSFGYEIDAGRGAAINPA